METGVSRRSLLAGAGFSLLALGGFAAGTWAEVERLCAAFVEQRRAPALSIAVSRRGSPIFSLTLGVAEVASGRQAGPRTPFRIASASKPFVGALFLLLERDGVLSLDDRLDRWFTAFPRAGELTLRALLSHTAGLGEYTRIPLDRLARDAARHYTAEQIVGRMAETQPLFAAEPGGRWTYSNTGYVLLGAVAERATGKPIGDLLAERVFQPLRLADTAWDHPPSPAAATGHMWRDGGWRPTPYVSASFVGASGAIRSTAVDLCAWGEALLAGSLLRPQEFERLLSPSIPGPGAEGAAYGLGVYSGRAAGRRVIWHTGSTAGFAADWRCYLDDQITIAMLANADPRRMGSSPRDIRRAVLNAALGAPLER